MVTFDNVTFRYKKTKVLENFSLDIEKGKVYGLLGKNGAGKSTMLYLMSGLLFPQKGQILFDGESVVKRKPSAFQDIYIVPEEFDLPRISLKKFVSANSSFYPNFSMEQLKKNLDFFEMDLSAGLGELSMGQKKKVFMSFALAANTSLLIMDEPTNGLDIPSKSQFRKFIASGMSDERTVLISTHQVKDVENLLDQVVVVENRKILLNASVFEIGQKLSFVEGVERKHLEEALYALPSLTGNKLILPNKGNEETPLDLELLFNALLSRPQEIISMFNN